MHDAVLLVSHETMSELADVLAKSKFDSYVSVDERVQFIRLIANIAELVPIVNRVRECRNPKDDKFLEVGLNGRANFIITGDDDLLRMSPWRGIEILSPLGSVERSAGD